MVEPMCECIHNMKEKGQPVLKIWQYNADKNKKLVKCLKYKDWKLDVEVDYMARDTPQQNSLTEQGFIFIFSKIRATLNAANVSQEQCYKLFSGCAMTVTKLD